MTSVGTSLRVIGISPSDVSDWREPAPAGKWSQFFGELSKRVTVADVVQPKRAALAEWLGLARAIHPSRRRWVARVELSVRRRAMLNAVLERELARREGSYDLIMQLQTLCAPPPSASYAIYTDNTLALTRRMFPEYAPVSEATVQDWLRFERGVCRQAEIVFTFSEFARTSVIADYGARPERVVAVGAGANQLRDSLDARTETSPRALFVGNEFERKGGEVLLTAWPLVRAQVPDAELVVAGTRRSRRPGLPAGVTWLGRLDRTQLDREYRLSTAFVMPSQFEAWGHVFVEAMGYGLPCVGSDCCAMPEIIENGRTGLLVAPGSPEPLAHALIALLGDRAKAAEMGRAGHAKVLATLTWGHVADRVLNGIRTVIPGPGG